jgi:hypothetical protein
MRKQGDDALVPLACNVYAAKDANKTYYTLTTTEYR